MKAIISFVALVALCACASEPRTPPTPEQAKAAAEQEAAARKGCLRETGSRTSGGADGCAGHGKVITRDELDRHQNVEDALEKNVLTR